MAKKCKKGVTVVEIEFQNYVKGKADEMVACGDFPSVSSLVNFAIMYAAGRGYFSLRDEYLAMGLKEFEQYL